MNLRIPDAPAMVRLLYGLVAAHGSPVMSVGEWQVSEIGGRFLYHGSDSLEVGGPYPDLGSLVRDAGWQRHAEWREGPPRELVWDVVAWGGAFFTVHTARLAAPTRHATLGEAVAAGLAGTGDA